MVEATEMPSASGGWNRDTTIGVVGALVLIAAMVAVFAYESNSTAALDDYAVTWHAVEASRVGPTNGPTLDAGASETHTFQVTGTDIAEVVVELAWTDDVGDADTFHVRVTGPYGRTGALDSSSGSLSLTIPVTEPPEATTVHAGSQDGADARADGLRPASTGGVGAWTVDVTLQSAPGTTVPVVGSEAQADGSNDYTITFRHAIWEPKVGTASAS